MKKVKKAVLSAQKQFYTNYGSKPLHIMLIKIKTRMYMFIQ